MLKRFVRSTHLKFGVIAAALCALSLFVGLSAYLTTDTDPYSPTFQTASGADLGLALDGAENLPSEVIPREMLGLFPTVSTTGSIPLYVFVEVDYGGLEIPVSSGEDETVIESISSDWYPLGGWKSESNYTPGGTQVYYLGTESSLVTLDDPSTVFEYVSIPADDAGGNSYSPTITAYGIQAQGVDGTDPSAVWDLIQGGTQP